MGRGEPLSDLKVALKAALAAGEPDVVRKLVEFGADLHYRDGNGYDALINAVYGRDILSDSRLIELLSYLIERRVELSGVSTHSESGLRVLSRIGRFDGVELLLKSGADERLLEWTQLHRAVASGTYEDVRTLLVTGADLEARDTWERTPWLISLLIGDIEKANLLLEAGADRSATGRCGQPPLFYPIRSRKPEMVRWLLGMGFDHRATDEFGSTTLIEAVEVDDLSIVELLIVAGADVEIDHNGTALSRARSRSVATRLLDAGADPATLTHEGHRLLLGLGDYTHAPLDSVNLPQFQRASTRMFGDTNPHLMNHPYWIAMIRAGISGYEARQHFKHEVGPGYKPVWCAQRFGQSLTLLPDGRAVQIGGEHEDYYDPDFCIYNDVFVHHPDGSIEIYGYPEDIFPPTDFHTATPVGDAIYVIGSLGYQGTRVAAQTPVYRLDINTLQINQIETVGDSPGWLFRHRAEKVGELQIRVWSGTSSTFDEHGKESHRRSESVFILDTRRRHWRRDN